MEGGELDGRLADLIRQLDEWGEPAVAEEFTADGTRHFRVQLWFESYDKRRVRLIFDESWRPHAGLWSLHQYHYTYMDRDGERHFAHHNHPIAVIAGPSTCVPHVHCRPPRIKDRHYAGHLVDLDNIRWDYLWWAADPALYPDCLKYAPLETGPH